MDDRESVYEKLLTIWSGERSSEGLTQLDMQFFNSLTEYVSSLKHKVRLSTKDSLTSMIKNKELEIIRDLVKSIFEIRYRKILDMALRGEEPENMLPIERRFYNMLFNTLDEYREILKGITTTFRIPKVVEGQRYETVAFLSDSPKIVGEDLREYGPFKAGDIASLPLSNASSLIKHGIAKRISIHY